MSLTYWLQNLLAYSIQITVLAAVGASAARLFPVRIPKVKLVFWQILLLLCLACPLLQPWRIPSGIQNGGVVNTLTTASFVVPRSAWTEVAFWIAGVLITGAVFRSLWLVVGTARLRRYRLRALMLTEKIEAVSGLKRTLGVRADLLLSDDVEGPVTFGLLRPVVLLPSDFARMPDAKMRAVVCHELLHVKRGDWVLTIAEECLRAVLWFHPAVHWLVGRIRLSREQAVDHEVVLTCGARQDYLEALIDIARSSRRLQPVPGLLCLGRPHLKDRIELLLKEVTMSRMRLSLNTTASAAVILFAGVLAVWSFPLVGKSDDTRSEADIGHAQSNMKSAIKSGKTVGKQEPRVVKKVLPIYPTEARKSKIQGSVVLEMTIAETGEVKDVSVLQGIPELNQAAIDAVRQWRYEPVRADDGEPVAVKMVSTINFKLENKKADSASSEPQSIHKVDPIYPAEAKEAGIQGEVVLDCTIDATGEVKDLRVKEGVPELNQAAIDAVKQWRYRPVLGDDGKPREVGLTITVRFKLADEKAK